MYETHIMTDINNDTAPEQMAPWVQQQDRIPLLLAISLYKAPRKNLADYKLIVNSDRIGIWINTVTKEMVVATRGTSPFSLSGMNDIADDVSLATKNICNLSIVHFAEVMVNKHFPEASSIVFVGHSLGGTAAFCLTQKYLNQGIPVRGIGFNSGAAPTNPILSGPGPQVFRNYHIVGDIISSHMSPQAAEIVRIKKSKAYFGGTWAHSTPRLLANDGDWAYSSADEEDKMFYDWGKTYKPGMDVLIPGASLAKLMRIIISSGIVDKNPIPGSTRFANKV